MINDFGELSRAAKCKMIDDEGNAGVQTFWDLLFKFRFLFLEANPSLGSAGDVVKTINGFLGEMVCEEEGGCAAISRILRENDGGKRGGRRAARREDGFLGGASRGRTVAWL